MQQKNRIFVLDDDEEMLHMMQLVLSRDYDVLVSANLANVMQQIREYQPQLLIIDHLFRGTKSDSILQEIKGDKRTVNIPIIFFSGSPNVAENAKKLGAEAYMEKPASVSLIRDTVATFFKESES